MPIQLAMMFATAIRRDGVGRFARPHRAQWLWTGGGALVPRVLMAIRQLEPNGDAAAVTSSQSTTDPRSTVRQPRNYNDPSLDDRDLVTAAIHDADAFAALYRRNVVAVRTFLYRRCGSIELADDITAAAFERALRNLHSFSWKGGGFRAWVMRIGANLLTDHHRRTRSEQRRAIQAATEHSRSTSPSDPGSEHDALIREQHELDEIARVRDALDNLNERYARVISLRYFSGLDTPAIAAALDISPATLAVLTHRALRALERALQAPTSSRSAS